MAVRKDRKDGRPDLRGHLTRRLTNLRDQLMARDGELHEPFVIAYGLDRLDALTVAEPVRVQGYEIREALPPKQRGEIESLAVYALTPDNLLIVER